MRCWNGTERSGQISSQQIWQHVAREQKSEQSRLRHEFDTEYEWIVRRADDQHPMRWLPHVRADRGKNEQIAFSHGNTFSAGCRPWPRLFAVRGRQAKCGVGRRPARKSYVSGGHAGTVRGMGERLMFPIVLLDVLRGLGVAECETEIRSRGIVTNTANWSRRHSRNSGRVAARPIIHRSPARRPFVDAQQFAVHGPRRLSLQDAPGVRGQVADKDHKPISCRSKSA